MKTAKKLVAPLAVLLVFIAFLVGCAVSRQNQPTVPVQPSEQKPPAPSAQIPTPKANVAVYYLKMTERDAYLVREVHQVEPAPGVVQAALYELIKGTPVTPGAKRVLPPETKILGVKIDQGLATVNFSAEVLKANVGATGEALGITSIVNTLTEFPNIKKVSFLVEGKLDERAKDWWGHVGLYKQPFSRNLQVVHEPAIWVTAPAPGQVITSPVEIRGSARVFEGTVNARLKDTSGRILAQGFTTATQGAPGRGDFQLKLDFKPTGPGKGQIEVSWISPKDGSELDKVVVPVEWR
ncbi:MAG: spore gernimation protein [Firmicutes bacterium]|nr:spore gernimation protein [Bacillota bacterium]